MLGPSGGDVLTEVFGYRQARRVIWLGFLCNLIAVVAIWVCRIMKRGSIRKIPRAPVVVDFGLLTAQAARAWATAGD